MGVYFSEKGATSQLQSVYLIIAQFLPATVVSAWLSSSHLLWKGYPTNLLMVFFVDDIFLSKVWISEVFRSLFVSCVLLCVYGLVQMFHLNTIHSRRSATHQMPQFFVIFAFSAGPSKAFPAWLLTPNELMVDPPDDPSVTMAKMEAFILYFLMIGSEIVASRDGFSRFFLFHYFRSGRPLCRVVELSLLRLAASQALWISSQWGLTKSLNHFFSGYVPWNSNPLLS